MSLQRNFTFSQEQTHVTKMMDMTTEVLKHARNLSNGPGDLWQLQIVISDGILEDHEKVRALARRAADERILLVFVILDRRESKHSILQMNNVSYVVDPSTGRQVLQMKRYMDTFPFDFFVVVQNIEELPSILSDTLRQYFMYVSK
jgi:midasin